MITIDLVTGFLGSGKTTFLLKYARYWMRRGMRIGILEYDYGAVNVDMLLLNPLRGPKCELEMVAAACDQDCLERRFRSKLIAMAMNGYDRVIVEPSGVFDMDMFLDALREEPLENWYEIGSILTVVDANLSEEFDLESDFILASQVADAGCILLSKTQLASDAQIAATKEHIARAAESIHCKGYCTNYFEKDWETLTDEDFLKISQSGYEIHSYEKVIAGRPLSFSTVCLLDCELSLQELKECCVKLMAEDAYGHVIRIKGFASDAGESYELNATRKELTTRSMGLCKGVVIVIGTGLKESEIKQLLSTKNKN